MEQLVVSSTLDHDGDGVIRFHFSATNTEFAASTSAWGNPSEHIELSKLLTGFPTANTSKVIYTFGTPASGTCTLEFYCTNGSGHIGVWVGIESSYPVDQSKRFERASLFLRTEANAVDSFVSSLQAFIPGKNNRAVLIGRGL